MNKILLVIFFFSLVRLQAKDEFPAMISLDLNKQNDTVGYNLVLSFPALLNEGIHNGTIPLWDSPKKEKKLSPVFVKHLEEANNVQFSKQQFLFIHELWSTTARSTSFQIIGFSFIGQNQNESSKFKYGYVEMKDIEVLLKKHFIPVNINGSYHTTFWDALYHRDYNFNLLQIGSRYFTTTEAANEFKADYFNPKKRITSYIPIPEIKFVSCRIHKACIYKSPEALKLFAFFNEHYGINFQDFLNDGGERILNANLQIDINGIEIGGIWKKVNGKIITQPLYLLLFVDSIHMDTLTVERLKSWAMPQVQELNTMLLHDHKSDLKVAQINSIPIEEKEGTKILELLRYYRWNKLSWPVIYK